MNNAAEGVVAWEYRDPSNINNYLSVYTSRIKLQKNSITSEATLLIPQAYATPFPYINSYGNIVITYSANNDDNYIVFTQRSIQKGVIIFEDTTAKNTYSSICRLFLNNDGLKSSFREKDKAFYQKGL